jgi:hypothetical protein
MAARELFRQLIEAAAARAGIGWHITHATPLVISPGRRRPARATPPAFP